jgi:hypothetical protein
VWLQNIDCGDLVRKISAINILHQSTGYLLPGIFAADGQTNRVRSVSIASSVLHFLYISIVANRG